MAGVDSRAREQQTYSLPGIAEYYDVSVKPVRSAIGRLIEAGIVCKRSNGRIEVTSKRRGKRAKAAPVRPPRTPRDWDWTIVGEVMAASLARDPIYAKAKHRLRRKLDVELVQSNDPRVP